MSKVEHVYQSIPKETEKAYLVQMNGVGYWIPKSACELKDGKILIHDWFARTMDNAGAMFSEDNTHRYVLWRTWRKKSKLALCIGLNPSTAQKDKNSPTVDRLVTALDKLGYGGIKLVNLFSIISSSPEILMRPEVKNDEERDMGIIFGYSLGCQDVIFCWGTFDEAKDRSQKVIEWFSNALCFGKNKDGSPWHPQALVYAGLDKGKARLFPFREHTYDNNIYDRKEKKKRSN